MTTALPRLLGHYTGCCRAQRKRGDAFFARPDSRDCCLAQLFCRTCQRGRRDRRDDCSRDWRCCTRTLLVLDLRSELIFLSQTPPQVPLQGFDRLLEAGFSQDDIDQMRHQFHLRQDSANVEHGPVVLDDENEHQRALEDQWIEGMGNSDAAALAGDACMFQCTGQDDSDVQRKPALVNTL